MITAHVGGLPLEEMLPLAPGAGAVLMLARAWLTVRLRRRRLEPEPLVAGSSVA